MPCWKNLTGGVTFLKGSSLPFADSLFVIQVMRFRGAWVQPNFSCPICHQSSQDFDYNYEAIDKRVQHKYITKSIRVLKFLVFGIFHIKKVKFLGVYIVSMAFLSPTANRQTTVSYVRAVWISWCYRNAYLVRPEVIEFWQGQDDHLDNRIQFETGNRGQMDGEFIHPGAGEWTIKLLSP